VRGAQLRRVVAITARHASDAVAPEPTRHADRQRVYANRAERRARVDDEEIVPPELARRPPLTDGDD
jgi:hypothetical protein